MHKLLIALVSLLLVAGCDSSSGSPSTRDRVERLAQREVGEIGEVEVEPRETVGGCEFYNVTVRDVLDYFPPEYVVLPDEQIVSSMDGTTANAAEILRRCGAGAAPEWWAAIVESFSGEGTGLVVGPEDVGSAEERIRATGETYAPPALTETDAGQQMTYFTRQLETYRLHKVEAVLPDEGPVTVSATEL